MMWWLRRSSRLFFYAFGRYKSKTCSNSRIFSHLFSPDSRISENVLKKTSGTNINSGSRNCIDGGKSKRFYYVDRNKVAHFKPRGCSNWIRNPNNLRKLGLFGLLGSAVVIPAYLWNLESVPYTERRRLMLYSTRREKKLGELFAEMIKKDLFPGRIVPSHHPESVRVEKIMHNILEAAQNTKITKTKEKEKVGKLTSSPNLEKFKWEIYLVNEPSVNAFNIFGGKVFVYTGLLDLLKTDAEVAAVIAHEVGHGVGRHLAEMCSNDPWVAMLVFMIEVIPEDQPWLFTILELIIDQIYQYFLPDNCLIYLLSALFLTLPYSRRMEMEADYMGLVLMASAGYDPRVAPKVFDKLGEWEDGGPRTSTNDFIDVLEDYVSTHPCTKTRSNLLSQPKLMDEALSLYTQAQAQPT